ncbi:11974_t:CDS:2 [Funneliformis caledonium]|uniref:11974_t:CDS:1 n=1 Tax=Funneliformis caledonium TaxID=1117310 RepID=A0A9N8V8H3_9GLOM|nr:11974_t:CDS:2 [Funneliformis caledonium]
MTIEISSLDKIRDSLYELLNTYILPSNLMKEHRSVIGSKAIIHIEAFVINAMYIIGRHKEGLNQETSHQGKAAPRKEERAIINPLVSYDRIADLVKRPRIRELEGGICFTKVMKVISQQKFYVTTVGEQCRRKQS